MYVKPISSPISYVDFNFEVQECIENCYLYFFYTTFFSRVTIRGKYQFAAYGYAVDTFLPRSDTGKIMIRRVWVRG